MNYLRRIFFNLWYFRNPPWDTGISPPELMDFIHANPAGRALDLGCGTGTNAITLAQHGWQVIGVDFARHAINQAKHKSQSVDTEVDFRVEDVTRLESISGSFDLILDIGCFHSLSHQGKRDYANNLDRFLKPGGTYLMYAFFKRPGESRSGLLESELDLIPKNMKLIERQEGTERGRRPSAWLTYQYIK